MELRISISAKILVGFKHFSTAAVFSSVMFPQDYTFIYFQLVGGTVLLSVSQVCFNKYAISKIFWIFDIFEILGHSQSQNHTLCLQQ